LSFDDLFDDLMEVHSDNTPVDRSDIQRAPFPYIGGKSESIPHLMKLLPYRNTWCDHFTGSCVVTLNRQPSRIEVINDRYAGIVAFYRCLRDPIKHHQLVEWLKTTCHSREDFNHCRDTWCTETDDVVRAAKWFYMARNSISAAGRSWARGTKTIYLVQTHKSLELFQPIHYRLLNVHVENLNAEDCAKDYDQHDCVHYFDPPYLDTDCSAYLTDDKWNANHLESLLRTISDLKGFVALSHYDHPLINKQSFWTKKYSWKVTTYANKGDVADTKGDATECLWIKDH
jgi:DNA adenine methylase